MANLLLYLFQLVNAAVIVDPSVRQIIASETDQVYPSSAPRDMASAKAVPLKERVESNHCHSIDRVTNASSEICLNGILDKLNSSLSTVACLNPWQWSVQSHDCESQWHPLRHASVVAIESSAARYRYLFPNPTDNAQPSNADCPAKRQKTNSHNPEVSSLQPKILKCSPNALTSKAYSLTLLRLTNRSKITRRKKLLEILQ